MFFFWAFASVIGYSVQEIMLVKYARKIDSLSLAIYRNLSFLLTLSPLLLFTSTQNILKIGPFLPQILLSGLTGACSLWLNYQAYRYLPVGILSSLNKSVVIITLNLYGYFFFRELLPQAAFFFIGLILIGTIYLGIQKNHMPHLEKKIFYGFFYCILGTLFTATSIFLMMKTSRELDPFVSGFFWESSIGLFALSIGLLRSTFSKTKIQKISPSTFFKITLAASPTLLGTGSLAFASTLGPVGLISAISVSSIILVTLLAHFLYHEKLTTRQWLGIIILSTCILALKLTT